MLLSIDVDSVTPMLWRERADLSRLSPAEIELRLFGLREGLPRLIDLLSRLEIQATVFVPAYVAEHNPALVEAVCEGGHEIGVHGYLHEEVGALSRTENLEILDRSIGILERMTGVRPVGYRSPSWDMVSYLPAALAERHIVYDSSLMGFERPYRVDDILELPVSWSLGNGR